MVAARKSHGDREAQPAPIVTYWNGEVLIHLACSVSSGLAFRSRLRSSQPQGRAEDRFRLSCWFDEGHFGAQFCGKVIGPARRESAGLWPHPLLVSNSAFSLDQPGNTLLRVWRRVKATGSEPAAVKRKISTSPGLASVPHDATDR